MSMLLLTISFYNSQPIFSFTRMTNKIFTIIFYNGKQYAMTYENVMRIYEKDLSVFTLMRMLLILFVSPNKGGWPTLYTVL